VHYFHSLREQFLPVSHFSSLYRIEPQFVAFVHTVYSDHFYEIETLNFKNSLLPSIFETIGNFYSSLTKFSFPTKFPFKERAIYFHLKALAAQSEEEFGKAEFGSSIYYLKTAAETYLKQSRAFKNMFSEFGDDFLEKYNKNVVSPSIPIIDFISPKNPLRYLKTFHSALQEALEITIRKFVPNDQIIQKAKTIKQNYISANGSVSTLLDLFFQCGTYKQNFQQKLFNSRNPNHKMVSDLQTIESSIDEISKIITSLQNDHSFLFEGDETNQKLNQIQNEINQVLVVQLNEFAIDDVPKVVAEFNLSLQQYEIDPSVFETIEKATIDCFALLSNEIE
jgi:hypothetical protein